MARIKSAGVFPHELTIEYRSLSELKAYSRNVRNHSRRQLRQLANSIKTFGFTCPVLITEDGEIVAGHARWEVAKQLKLPLIPTVQLPAMSDRDRRAYILADNRLPELATWDRDLLATELRELVELDTPDISVTGFTLADIDIRLDKAAGKRGDAAIAAEDALPAFGKEVVTRRGDVWCLGPHRLLCGSATSELDYKVLMSGSLASLSFAASPVNRPARDFSGRGRIRHPNVLGGCAELTEDEYVAYLSSFLQRTKEVVTPGSIIFTCMDWPHIHALLTAGRQQELTLEDLIVWAKSTAGSGSFYKSQHELLAVFKNGDAPPTKTFQLRQHGRNRSNLWRYAGGGSVRKGPLENQGLYPSVKPVAMIADAIRDVTKRGAIVLDPFAGRGSTLIASEKTGRKAYMLELDPRYCDVVVRRWQIYAGRSAQLEASGSAFEQVEAERAAGQTRRTAP